MRAVVVFLVALLAFVRADTCGVRSISARFLLICNCSSPACELFYTVLTLCREIALPMIVIPVRYCPPFPVRLLMYI
jgi:hypothetical protein